MPDWIDEGAPFWLLFAFFFAVVLLRSQATYWLARLVTGWSVQRARPRSRWAERVRTWLDGAGTGRGVRAVERWGLVAVPVSFLATGTKTAVNAGAGVLRMPYGRYCAAMLVGCAVHATIYATVGWAAWTAALHAATGSPWAAAGLGVLLAGVVALVVVHRRRALRRRRGRAPGATGGARSS